MGWYSSPGLPKSNIMFLTKDPRLRYPAAGAEGGELLLLLWTQEELSRAQLPSAFAGTLLVVSLAEHL
jgi:hypothetical protein